MSKLWKRLSSEEFQNIFKNGIYASGNYINVIIDKTCSVNCIGFAVKKGKRSIILRNKIRRRTREAFIKIQDFLPKNYKIAIIANPESVDANLSDISAEIIRLVDKIKLRLRNSV
jgi:ribonuclease P protein component